LDPLHRFFVSDRGLSLIAGGLALAWLAGLFWL
jgi:hypothetical protein